MLEGIDNVGKTTQISRLSIWLDSKRASHCISRELTTPIGHLIRSYFGTPPFTPILKTLLFAADRMQRLDQDIEPALRANMIVLADRWVLSAIAYRAVEGLDRQFVLQVNSLVKVPDVTILIDIPSDESWKRGQLNNKPCPYSADFLKEVRRVYLELADEFQIPVVDGLPPPEQVSASIIQAITNKTGDPLWYR